MVASGNRSRYCLSREQISLRTRFRIPQGPQDNFCLVSLLLVPPLSCAHWISLTQSPVAGGWLHVSSVIGNRPGRNDVLLQNSPREPPFWTDDLQREGSSFRSRCVPPRVGSPSDSVQYISSPFTSTQRKGRTSGETGA